MPVTDWVPGALNSMVEVVPRVMTGLLVELMAVKVPPEKPLGLAVLNIPLMVAEPGVVGKEIILVPASMVEPADTVRVLELASPMLKLFVEKKLPVFTFPTAIFPVTNADVMAAFSVAPAALVLLMYNL